ncbi:MAG: type II toxin-antitoxin system RatA family toxin [Woeseia sp.]|jgi:ribosome-associated toxin RatA of RatAB toxin-antitoxin module|nr:type II toxin-antitoxin system RatA family toxin [Woeseia sp.]
MRTVNRSALVTYSAQQMFELVDDVDSYADFLPWCNRSEVLSRSNNIVEAMVELQKGAITKSFTTRNTLTKYESIDLALLGGPFKSLAGGWTFDQIGSDGCKVTLALQFDFESRLVDMLFGAFFEETCNSLVDAFTGRAAQVYDL